MIRIVTLVTDETRPEFGFLQRSNKTPWPVENIGIRDGLPVKWAGWTGRMRAYKAYAQSVLDAGGSDVMICFIDGYDVLMHPEAETRLREQAALLGHHDVIVGAERYMAPHFTPCRAYHDSMPDADQRRMRQYGQLWAQMGVIAGRPKALVELYDWILEHKFQDDQAGLGAYLNEALWPKVRLDYNQRLVANLHVNPVIWKSYAYDFRACVDFSSAFLHYPGGLSKRGLNYQFNECIRSLVTGRSEGTVNRDTLALIVALVVTTILVIGIRKIR